MVSQFATRYCLEQFSKGSFLISAYYSAEEALADFTQLLLDGHVFPDIIFLDLGLVEMDGWAFIEALEQLLNGKDAPEIYILSAFGQAKDRELAQNHPLVHGYMDKPLTRNRLEKIFQAKLLP